jgi:nucleoside-diphosphate-sugar epimerase
MVRWWHKEVGDITKQLPVESAPSLFQALRGELLLEDDPKRMCPHIGRAKEVLGWKPRVPGEEGLKKTLDWFAGRSERVCEVS